MSSGTVKWFNTSKGFGFIQPDDGGADVFVHVSAVERAGLYGLNEGQRVNFEMEQDRRSGKTSAGNLQVLDDGNAPPARAPRSDRGPRAVLRPPAVRPRAKAPAVAWSSGSTRPRASASCAPMTGAATSSCTSRRWKQAGLHGLEEGQAIDYEVMADRRTGKLSATNLRVR